MMAEPASPRLSHEDAVRQRESAPEPIEEGRRRMVVRLTARGNNVVEGTGRWNSRFRACSRSIGQK
jgi:hypothetical protein